MRYHGMMPLNLTPEITAYVNGHLPPVDPLFDEIEQFTRARMEHAQMLSGRLQKITEEILLAGNIILFVPNMHDLFRTAEAKAMMRIALSLSQYPDPPLANGGAGGFMKHPPT